MGKNATTIIFVALALFILLIRYFIMKATGKKKALEKIRQGWSSIPDRKYGGEQMEYISSYFLNVKQHKPTTHIIDDITWNDLDLESIFKRMNNTCSSTGEGYLYALLRLPTFDSDELSRRETLLQFFIEHPQKREILQLILTRLGKQDYVNITDYLFRCIDLDNDNVWLYRILSLVPFAALGLIVLNPGLGILLLLTSFITNMSVYYRKKSIIGARLESLSYLVSMVFTAGELAKLDMPEIGYYQEQIRNSYKAVKSMTRKAFHLFYTNSDPMVEYAKILMLRELIDYKYIQNMIHKHSNELLALFEGIGMLDSLIAAASYKSTVAVSCIPVLYRYDSSHPRTLTFRDLYHPLISQPVPNSLSTSHSILVTGSNASGKSTFLKTAAINAILAQTLHFCLAQEYSSCYFAVFTSMALKDNLSSGESYYIAEIKSLKRILDALGDEKPPVLCVVDEVLRGTNTVERIAASSQVLAHLGGQNCLCLAATHDIELTGILETSFDNYHFQEYITDNDITFDYRIHPGKATTRNAIKLLRFIGYDQQIVDQAESMAEIFLQHRRWQEL